VSTEQRPSICALPSGYQALSGHALTTCSSLLLSAHQKFLIARNRFGKLRQASLQRLPHNQVIHNKDNSSTNSSFSHPSENQKFQFHAYPFITPLTSYLAHLSHLEFGGGFAPSNDNQSSGRAFRSAAIATNVLPSHRQA